MLSQYQQPRGFTVFFLTEMWERYGFYVIQTLLIFYLTLQLHFEDKEAYLIVGSFTALAYINSIFGGIIADKLIGSSNSILFGGSLLFIGYTLLSIIHSHFYIFYFALAIISVGTGLLKPNVSSLLSILYPNQEINKEKGYTLYYVGIYIGALAGSLIGGYLQKHTGWSFAFYSAACGSLLSVITFIIGIYKYKLADKRKLHINWHEFLITFLIIAGLIFISYFVLHFEILSIIFFTIVGIFCLMFLIYNILTHNGKQKQQLIAFFVLILLSVGYWGIYFQQFFSISLCIARLSNSNVPASSLSAIESLGIIIFGPIINILWSKLQTSKSNISINSKFSVGFLFNAFGFLIISFGIWIAIYKNQYINLIFIAIAYLIIAIGELSLSPTSLSMVSTLVPQRLSAIMMGISLLSIGFGGKLAGLLANNAIINSKDTNLSHIKHIYLFSFLEYFVISMIIFIFTLILNKFLRKLIYSN